MAYITDLILIMQNLFWLTAEAPGSPVSRRLVKFAFQSYDASSVKAQVHFQILEHVTRSSVSVRADRDSVLEKIVELINSHRIYPAEMVALGRRIGVFDRFGGYDEPWDVPQDG
jgi:hypothetical protein